MSRAARDYSTSSAAFLGFDSGDRPLERAAEAFQRSWRGLLPRFADNPSRSLAGDAIYEDRCNELPMDAVAGWLTYDVLWHLKHGQPGVLAEVGAGGILARESIPLLTTGPVLHLVVEVLPGPAGLVTPDWWPMGLVHFPPTPEAKTQGLKKDALFADFLTATQQVMSVVTRRMGLQHRIRWRLEHRHGKLNPWREPVVGRSAEAAAAIVARAVCEAIDSADTPVLDPAAAITACVRGMDVDGAHFGFQTTELECVDGATLKFKLGGAQKACLRSVLLASDQGPQWRALAQKFTGLHVEACDNLEYAYQQLRYDNPLVAAFRQHIVLRWHDRWSEEETPRERR